MHRKHGNFVWYELMTTDVAAGVDFYSHVVGWNADLAGGPARPFPLLSIGAAPVAGVVPICDAMRSAGVLPTWMGTIEVDDIDGAVKLIEAEGGIIHVPPTEVTDFGHYAVVGDPCGGTVNVSCFERQPSAAGVARNTPGLMCWRELHVDRADAAFDFYASVFGWTKAEAHDLGHLGTYQLFANGAEPIGAMMNRPSPDLPAGWRYYVYAAAMDAALERVLQAGGAVEAEPREIADGSWIARFTDPQGAGLSIVAPKR